MSIDITAASRLPNDLANSAMSEVSSVGPADADQAETFKRLLYAGVPSSLSPEQMLSQQAGIMSTTVGIDLSAKVVGALSQSVNKLTSMT